MTLNITMITPGYVVQASDRRMTSMPVGTYENDEANKGIVLKTKDGMFAITFAGVGTYKDGSGEKRIDLWLSERLAKEGGPELPIKDAIALIMKESTKRFSTFGATEKSRHTFVVAGWTTGSGSPEAHLWDVSNCAEPGTNKMMPTTAAMFETVEYAVESGAVHIRAFGLHQSLGRGERRRLDAATKRRLTVDQAESVLVGVMRAAAAKPKWRWGINGEILTIAIARTGETRARLHRDGQQKTGYAPLLLYHRDGWTVMTGDGHLSAPEHYAANFGDVMLVTGCDVAPPGAPPPGLHEVSFRWVWTPGKFNEPDYSKGAISLPGVGIQPISVGAKAAFEGGNTEGTQS